MSLLAFSALALSSHSLLEGLAVGVEKHVKDVWALFIGTFYFD